MESLPTAPTDGKRTRAGIPACLLFTSVTERNKHAQPNTVTNRMATYRVRAGSIVEPCGRVFHRVEQSPESKECQHLQQAPRGQPDRKAYAATGGANNPPTHQQLKVANHTPYRPNGCGVPTCACTSLTSCPGLTGTALPSTSRAFKCGVRFCRTGTKPGTAELNDGRNNNHSYGYGLGPTPVSGRSGIKARAVPLGLHGRH